MEILSRRHGTNRWAQKATCYIFYVEEILQSFRNARLIYLARNPLDLAASLKRRGNARYFLNMIWAWNRGIRLAEMYQRKYPDNFLIVRYEDIVRSSDITLRRIFDFAGLGFDPSYAQIPHVNRSETGYNLTSDSIGINASRVFYYRYVLTLAEEAAIRTGMSRELVKRYYPELLSDPPKLRWHDIPGVVAVSLVGVNFLFGRQVALTLKNPQYALRRIRRRLG